MYLHNLKTHMNLEDVGSICKSKRQAGTQNPFWVHKNWHHKAFGFRDLCRVPSVLGLASQGVVQVFRRRYQRSFWCIWAHRNNFLASTWETFKHLTVQNSKLHKLQIIINLAILRTPNLFEGTTLSYRLGKGSHFQSLSYIAREPTFFSCPHPFLGSVLFQAYVWLLYIMWVIVLDRWF